MHGRGRNVFNLLTLTEINIQGCPAPDLLASVARAKTGVRPGNAHDTLRITHKNYEAHTRCYHLEIFFVIEYSRITYYVKPHIYKLLF